MWGHRVDEPLHIKNCCILGRLVLEQVVESAESQHDESLWISCIREESKHGLDVLSAGIARGVSFIGGRVQEVNTVKVHAWESFLNRESEAFIYAL